MIDCNYDWFVEGNEVNQYYLGSVRSNMQYFKEYGIEIYEFDYYDGINYYGFNFQQQIWFMEVVFFGIGSFG